MFKPLFRRLPYQSLDQTFWIILDDVQRHDVFRVNGKALNLSRAIDDKYRAPVLDYLMAWYFFLHLAFDSAADAINNFDFYLVSREGPYWRVSYDEDVVVEVNASAYCELRGMIYGAFEEAEDEALELLSQSIIQRPSPPVPLTENRVVYSFRSIKDHTLADLRNGTISVSSPFAFNDPYDSAYYDIQSKKRLAIKSFYRACCRGDEESFRRMSKWLDLQETVDKYFRIRCFVEDNPKERVKPLNRMDMWYAYADDSKGMCVQYSLSPKFQDYNDGKEFRRLHRVKYVESFKIDEDKQTTIGDAFYTKNICWEHENEVRLLSFNTDSDKTYHTIPLDKDSRVTDVYFGLKCSEENKEKVIEALGYSNARFHTMEKDADNYYVPTQMQHKLYYEGKGGAQDALYDLFGVD